MKPASSPLFIRLRGKAEGSNPPQHGSNYLMSDAPTTTLTTPLFNAALWLMAKGFEPMAD